MPTRDNDERFAFGAINNLRIRLPDNVGFQVNNIEDARVETEHETSGDVPPLSLIDQAEFTAEVDVDQSQLDLISELIGEVSQPPQPGYQEFVEARTIPHMPDPIDGLNASATATSMALRNALARLREKNTELDARIRAISQSELRYRPFWYGVDAIDALADMGVSAGIARESTESFMDALNDAWTRLGDNYELGEESQYVETDPISFDELMEFGGEGG